MDRYTYLYGTNLENTYCTLAYSDRLPDFLKSIGATSPSATIETARKYVNVHNKLCTGSDKALNTGVSVCYLPMYLRKLPYMPDNLKPFCAMGISGRENLQGRDTFYDKTVFIPMEYMLESMEEDGKRFTYLDQIFGTHLLSWQEVRDHRLKIDTLNCNELPEIINPKLQNKDFSVIVNTIKALFRGETVVIRLEADCAFNVRAQQLLTQIYSLLYPALAMETGFAAVYLDPQNMATMRTETSVRIFVVPAEFDLSAVTDGDILKLDLKNPATITPIDREEKKSNKLTRSICQWANLSWPQRREAMEVLFRNINEKFLDSSEFIRITEDFFSDSFFSWQKEPVQTASISSLEELKYLYDSFPLCSRISWVRELFKAKLPSLLGSRRALEDLVSEQYAAFICGDSKAGELAAFGLEMAGRNLKRMCLASASRGRSIGLAESAEEIVLLKNQISANETEKAQAVAAAMDRCEQQRIADVHAEQEKTRLVEAAHNSYVAEAEAKISGLNATLAKADEEKAFAVKSAIETCEQQRIAEIRAEQEKTRLVEAAHNSYVAEAEAKISGLNATLAKADEEKAFAVKSAINACEQQRIAEIHAEQEKTRLVKAAHEAYVAETEAKLSQKEAAGRQLQTKLQSVESALQNIQVEADRKTREAERLASRAERKTAEAEQTLRRFALRQIICIAIGFAAALLIVGLVSLVRSIFFAPPDELAVSVPVVTQEAEILPDAVPESQPVVQESPVPSTEPTVTPAPQDTVVETIAQSFAEISYIETQQLEEKLELPGAAANYRPVAIFSLDAANQEESSAAPQNFVVLAKCDLQSESDKAEEAVEALRSSRAQLILANETWLVYSFGNDLSVRVAMGIFAQVAGDDQETVMALKDVDGEDIAPLFQQAIRSFGSGAKLVGVSTDRAYLQERKNNFSINAEPVIYLELDNGFALVLRASDAEDAEACAGAIDSKYNVYCENCDLVIFAES